MGFRNEGTQHEAIENNKSGWRQQVSSFLPISWIKLSDFALLPIANSSQRLIPYLLCAQVYIMFRGLILPQISHLGIKTALNPSHITPKVTLQPPEHPWIWSKIIRLPFFLGGGWVMAPPEGHNILAAPSLMITYSTVGGQKH